MLSKQQIAERWAEVDAALTAILRQTVTALVEQVEKRGFAAPVAVNVLDASGATLRSFTITEKGKIVAARSGNRKSVCVFPLKILAIDRRQRVARVRIGSNRFVEKPEFLN